jgi:surface antigen
LPSGTFRRPEFKKPNAWLHPAGWPAAKQAQHSLIKIFGLAGWLKARPRLVIHVFAVALVTTIVTIGRVGTTDHRTASLLLSRAADNLALDRIAAANVAAAVAEKADLLVAPEATKQAGTMNAQVALATAGDDFLAKRQVVATANVESHTIQDYKVQPGDTLSGIAVKFNVTSSTVKWANNLDDVDELKPGQELVILPISGLLYTVQAGDTAESLADKYQSNAAQIISFNNAEVKGLTAGQKIIIPDGVKNEPKPAARPAVAAGSSSPRVAYRPSYSFSGNGYAFGYCTWYVAGRRGNLPTVWGNAIGWLWNSQASGYTTGYRAAPGAIAWEPVGYAGHVAYVESVSGGYVTVSEMNFNGAWNRVTYRTEPESHFRYIY